MYSDETLLAYLNSALDPETATLLEEAVATNEALEARLMALDPMAAQVKAAFASVPDASRLTEFVPEAPGAPAQRSRFWELAAAVVVAGVIGFGGATLLQRDAESTWQEQVANYQALYVAETVAPIEPTEDGLRAQFARAERVLGRALDRGSVADLPGLTLKRAQVLAFNGTPLVQVAFAADDGTPVAFCIIQSKGDGTEDVAFETLVGLATAHWSRDGYSFMVIGGDDIAALKPITDRLSAVY